MSGTAARTLCRAVVTMSLVACLALPATAQDKKDSARDALSDRDPAQCEALDFGDDS